MSCITHILIVLVQVLMKRFFIPTIVPLEVEEGDVSNIPRNYNNDEDEDMLMGNDREIAMNQCAMTGRESCE